MTWDEARALEKKGISLGPHTVTHPVLSTLTAEDSAAEIGESWARVRAELQNPAPVFCYPHGRKRDFGEREFAEVQRLGLLGGVSGGFDVLTHSRYGRPPGICRVPRCGFREDLIAVLQCVSGVETIKERLRGRL
jgi:peptidoglycan/xylan/chitin deacetylase (PgdA/CDA1 family)